jgi:hypothetical protein
MHQLVIMFPGWAMFFHWAADGAHSFFSLGYVFSFGAKWGPFLFAGLCFFHLVPDGSISFRWAMFFSLGARWGPFLFCWAMFFHWAPDGVHFFLLGFVFSLGARWGPFLFAADHYITIIYFFVPRRFSLDLTSHITIIFTFLPLSVLHHPG